MIGLEVYLGEDYGRWQKEVLKAVFLQLVETRDCYPADAECIVNGGRIDLGDVAKPGALAEILGDSRTLTLFGMFFCYPEGQQEEDFETFEEFADSSCQDIILVVDGAYIEIYSKDEDYLSRCLKALPDIDEIQVDRVEKDTLGRTVFRIW